MSDVITVMTSPPFATIQDLGRTGFRDSGVPVSGLADRESGLLLNAILGNDPNAAMIECAVGGGAFRFDCATTIAVGGADAVISVNGAPVHSWSPIVVADGDELRIERIVRGRFVLVAVRGGIDAPVVLGSRSTLLSAGIGGLGGRRLRAGDRLPVGDYVVAAPNDITPAHQLNIDGPVMVMRGPQASLFDDAAWATFLSSEFVVSRASDRSGYRLDGMTISHSGAAALPSEPACVGAIQIPDGGTPIVIMHDGPTVGGYPKIAVIRTSCMSRFAQLTPGDRVRFAVD
jgi:antagonist of KipI